MSDDGGIERGRTLSRPAERELVRVVAVLIALVALSYVLDIFISFDITFYKEQFFGLLYGLVFAGGFLVFPATKGAPRDRIALYDYVLASLGLAIGLYVFIAYPAIVLTAGIITPFKTALGAIAVLIILELTRRIFGWPLVILAAIFILYAKFNYMLPGPLGGRGKDWARLAVYLYLDTNSMLGLIAAVVFGMVFAFILFGRVLFATGGADFFTDLSMALMGRWRGGPAKVAVVASSLFGTLSGSASSNVVITGSITIPMMTRIGYRPSVAAAVESVASSGGGLMPPIMGATAFIMAEFLSVPYREVVIAALLPAVLYYVSLFLQVDLEAAKAGIKGFAGDRIPRLFAVLLRGWVFVAPLALLVYCLFVIFLSPSKSAMIATAALVVVGFARRETWLTPRRAIASLDDTGRLLIEIGVIGAVAAIVVGIVNLTGLGLVFSQILLSVSGGSLHLLLLLTAAASIVLGMSMPVTASYIILAVLAAPALVEAGVPEMAAHLFIFYFAILSFITPPVCVAVYIASAIARSKPMETAVHAMKLGIVAYVVPFVFVADAALLMEGAPANIALAFVTAVIGFIGLAIALQGYYTRAVPWFVRVPLAAAAILALVDIVEVRVAGAVAVLVLVGWQHVAAARA